MSDKDTVQKLLERIAILEQRSADARSAPQAPPAQPTFDPRDPVGSLRAQGHDIEHLTRVLVANAMGDQAPAELRVLAQMGPQIAATRTLESKITDLANKVTSIVESGTKRSRADSFKAAASDKTKYPALAKALAADPDFFNEALDAHAGGAEEFAAREEAKLVKLGYYVPQPASEVDADTDDTIATDSALGSELGFDPNDDSIVANGQSTQTELAKQAPAVPPPPPKRAGGNVNSRMPPLKSPTAGVFSPEEHDKLRDEVVRKYSGRQQ